MLQQLKEVKSADAAITSRKCCFYCDLSLYCIIHICTNTTSDTYGCWNSTPIFDSQGMTSYWSSLVSLEPLQSDKLLNL